MRFAEKYLKAVKGNDSLLCVGLDSDREKLPECLDKEKNPMIKFNHEIINATSDIVCAYKPNAAFYESCGVQGFEAWNELKRISSEESKIPFIADVKRGDIGNTALHYAKACFEEGGFDAATINPYMGWDTVEPFLQYEEKYLFLLALTSNPSAKDFEYEGGLYRQVAKKVKIWNIKAGNRLGLVVGATHPDEMKEIREIAGDAVFLVPGVGTQGGDSDATIKGGFSGSNGNLIINVSRSIIFAGKGRDFAEKARIKAIFYRDMINNSIGR